MRLAIGYLVLCVLFAPGSKAAEPIKELQRKLVPKAPAVSHEISLRGSLVRERHFASPNFGQTPSRDKEETSTILRLRRRLCTPSSQNEPCKATNTHKSVQLVLSAINKSKKVQADCIVATGVLFRALTGHHHRPILMDVTDIQDCDQQDGDRKTELLKPHSRKGATIGAGVDLGQRDEAELRRLGVDEAIIDKVRPFLGLQGDEAKRALEAQPLRLSAAEACALTDKVHADIIRQVAENFNQDSRFDFFELPPEAQTVIAPSHRSENRVEGSRVGAGSPWRRRIA